MSTQSNNIPINDKLMYSEEAEQAVLGSCLIDPDAIGEIWQKVTPEHFYLECHQCIYEIMTDLCIGGDPCDYVTVTDELEKRHWLDRSGGLSYITQLTNAVPHSGNLSGYGQIVLDFARDRLAIAVAARLAGAAYGRQTAKALESIIGELLLLQEMDQHAEKWIIPHDEVLDNYEKIKQDRINGITVDFLTGFTAIDSWLGGLKRGHAVVICAQSSVGKTSFVRQLAYNMALQKIPQLYLTLEMAPEELAERGIAATANEAHQALYPGSQDISLNTRVMQGGFRYGGPIVHQPSVQIADESIAWQRQHLAPYLYWSSRDIDTRKLGALIAQAKRQQGIEVFLIDQAQHLDDENKNEVERLTTIAKTIKKLARKLKVVIVMVTQIKRDLRTSLPTEADIKGSGGYMEYADEVIILNRPELTLPFRVGDPDLYHNTLEVLGVKARGSEKNTMMLLHYTPGDNRIADWPSHVLPVEQMQAFIAQRREDV